jgi:hypothetical protein
MNRLRILLAIALLCAAAACGRMGQLEPAPGQSLPVKPRMAETTPTPEELLTPPPYADPKRVDEILKKSTPRKIDPFNLPPPGGEAPTAPVQELQNQTDNQAGPITPNGQ